MDKNELKDLHDKLSGEGNKLDFHSPNYLDEGKPDPNTVAWVVIVIIAIFGLCMVGVVMFQDFMWK